MLLRTLEHHYHINVEQWTYSDTSDEGVIALRVQQQQRGLQGGRLQEDQVLRQRQVILGEEIV